MKPGDFISIIELLEIAIKRKKFTVLDLINFIPKSEDRDLEYEVEVLYDMGILKMVDVEPDYTYKIAPEYKQTANDFLKIYSN